jgi:YihY family inner membrane protein
VSHGTREWRAGALQTARYLFTLETHVHAFAVAANALLSFFPFMVLTLSLARHLLRFPEAADVLYVGLADILPEDPGLVDFVMRNLRAAVESRGRAETASVLMLLFSSNGVFLPLEVAFNRLWGFSSDRSYWHNQLLSLGLAFACGSLALGAAMAAAGGAGWLQSWLDPIFVLPRTVTVVVVKLVSLLLVTTIVLLVYVVLPNGRVPLRAAARGAVLVGVALELARVVYLAVWPLLGLRRVYGPFFVSVTLLLGGYLAANILLAGAELMARRHRAAGQ